MAKWSEQEEKLLYSMYEKKQSIQKIAKRLGRAEKSVENKLWHSKRDVIVNKVRESSMPVYDQPLSSRGDAVILTDVEAPYHHADFINRVLDLADAWGVKDLHLGGDLLHYDNLSAWGAEWLIDDAETKTDMLLEFIQSLPDKYKSAGVSVAEKIGNLGGERSLANELTEARKVFASLTNFDNIYVALGNHDDRYLRALDKAIQPKELLVQMDRHHDSRWKIAPYYYTMLETEKGLYRIEHPRSAGRTAAQDLCIQYHCNIIMGHSHRWSVNRDPSGDYWAIQTGHCVDEKRLAYVMQRSAKRDAHCLGATIVRGGVPWVLGEWSQWDILKRM